VLAGKTDAPNVAMTDAVGSLEAFHDLPSVLEDEHQWVPFAKTIVNDTPPPHDQRIVATR